MKMEKRRRGKGEGGGRGRAGGREEEEEEEGILFKETTKQVLPKTRAMAIYFL